MTVQITAVFVRYRLRAGTAVVVCRPAIRMSLSRGRRSSETGRSRPWDRRPSPENRQWIIFSRWPQASQPANLQWFSVRQSGCGCTDEADPSAPDRRRRPGLMATTTAAHLSLARSPCAQSGTVSVWQA